MPRLRNDFPVTEPGGIGTYSVDFAPHIPPNTTVSAASWMIARRYVIPGAIADPTPQGHLVGACQIQQGTIAVQRIGALVAGNDYLVRVAGTISDGEVITLWLVLPCRSPQ